MSAVHLPSPRLALHGAMVAEGEEDPEGALLEEVPAHAQHGTVLSVYTLSLDQQIACLSLILAR